MMVSHRPRTIICVQRFFTVFRMTVRGSSNDGVSPTNIFLMVGVSPTKDYVCLKRFFTAFRMTVRGDFSNGWCLTDQGLPFLQ